MTGVRPYIERKVRIKNILVQKMEKGFFNYGEMAKIAKEVGVSKQRIGQIVKEIGKVPIHHVKPRCKNCGALTKSKSGICRKCRPTKYTTLPCGWCEKLVTRRTAVVVKNKHHQLFCNVACRRKWVCKNFFKRGQ